MLTPYQIAQEKMLRKDHFSQWLGIEISQIALGKCSLRMKVTQDMLNGFHIGHGGIAYSLADSALAFAANSYGFHAVSIETSISHIKPVSVNDVLTADAIEKSRNKKIGIYIVEIKNQDDVNIALFKGTVFIKETQWS